MPWNGVNKINIQVEESNFKVHFHTKTHETAHSKEMN